MLNQSASVSWDARAALNATVYDLSETLVREHLRACGSELLDEPDTRTIYRKMDLVRRVNAHEVPRNVALLFFSRDPARWFPGAKIEVAILRAGAGGDVIEEKEFGGGLADQVSGCLAYLRREVVSLEIRKSPDRWQASHRFNYPEEALREVLVNALLPPGLRPGLAPYDSGSRHIRSDRCPKHAGTGPGNRQRSDPPGSHAATGAPAQSADRRVGQGARAGREASHGSGQDPSGDGTQRFAAAGVPFR